MPAPAGRIDCGRMGTGTACFVDAGTANTGWRTPAAAAMLLITTGIATRRDVIVMNAGLHYVVLDAWTDGMLLVLQQARVRRVY